MTQTMSLKVESKKNCESIHSGQFMVSHFEQELDEYQDYPDNDDECEEITADTSGSSGPVASTSSGVVSMQLERYKFLEPERRISEVYEIDSDLSQVFNTLNVTYKKTFFFSQLIAYTSRQKLTSPKWNPFKGIRLRWKEKIRLNNVIWRCWHMQFIMKKRPLVCQFASPLDVDIHNTPQAIILEGKYWKRKWKVITAEYKKWRRFNVNKALGTSSNLDTKSELDTLEWSNNDNLLMLSDNMSSDTLFSTISQFPFPDSREIARAGRADFIQPSLGPLQPNFEDFMDFDLDIFNSLTNNRLAPVPEEQTEELLKAIEFPMIGSMDTSNMQDIMTTNSSNVQQSVIQGTSALNLNQHQNSANANPLLFTATIYSQDMSQSNQQQQQEIIQMQQNRQQINESSSQRMITNLVPFISGDITMNVQAQQSTSEQMITQSVDVDEKEAFKGKYPRGYLRNQLPKREPHNYDKCQPTPHQTTIYNQMLAQQENAQIYNNNVYGENLNDFSNMSHISTIQTTTTANNFNPSPASMMTTQNVLNLSNNQMTNFNNKVMMQQTNQISMEQQQQQQPLTNHNTHDSYKSPQSPSYRYHHGTQPYKIPSQTPGFNATSRIMMRQQSPPHIGGSASGIGKSMSFQQQNATAAAIKEMYRSNSLPINANIQICPNEVAVGDNFAVPKYLQASKKERRNSAVNLRNTPLVMPTLQSATSEPALNVNNSALAQLLTNSPSLLKNTKAHSISSSAMSGSVPHQPVRANSFTSSSLVQNSILLATNAISGQQQKTQTSSSTQMPSGSGIYTPTLSPDSAFQDTHDSSHSPERCLSLNKFHPRDNQRRAGHIHAEQKRRYNIKNGFDMLHSLIPQLQQNPNAKLSKASMLQKGAEYIKQLRMERASMGEQMEGLRKEIDQLTNSLNHLQNSLPANGAPVSRQRTGRVRELYQDYIILKTMGNWKFWIFGQIFEPLLNSYNSTVSTVSMDELRRTTMLWIDNNCSLMEVRPAVSNKLREISTTTDILSDNPTSLQDEVIKAVKNARPRLHENPR
ncbi:CLUMA_CG006597, isoform A [Clunio marinus]|uniref:CLUMA_CG006597, isoform A n=1 Tax=Clunio marinus TaxID=568069 RepID=A0A1J1HYF3_9DIPT|nr:CLUMA_CG006597, isoform A [Clunio marinus]